MKVVLLLISCSVNFAREIVRGTLEKPEAIVKLSIETEFVDDEPYSKEVTTESDEEAPDLTDDFPSEKLNTNEFLNKPEAKKFDSEHKVIMNKLLNYLLSVNEIQKEDSNLYLDKVNVFGAFKTLLRKSQKDYLLQEIVKEHPELIKQIPNLMDDHTDLVNKEDNTSESEKKPNIKLNESQMEPNTEKLNTFRTKEVRVSNESNVKESNIDSKDSFKDDADFRKPDGNIKGDTSIEHIESYVHYLKPPVPLKFVTFSQHLHGIGWNNWPYWYLNKYYNGMEPNVRYIWRRRPQPHL